jgi:hypothetical protein
MKNTLAMIVALLILTPLSFAQVWVDKEKWSDEWEGRFSQWISSPKVHREIFTSPTSPYKGIVADCADVAYVLRAIFAFENGLMFSAKNPVATSTSKLKHFTNRMTRFDTISDPHKRVVAFANYLGQSLGTETLVAYDSFALKLDKVSVGDMYLYKIKKNDQFVRHSYNIKNIDKRGNFELIYSTQGIRDAGGPMSQRVKGLYNAPTLYRWGFRRYDHNIAANVELSTNSRGARSEEQYALAKQLGERGFFAHVKGLLREEVENPDSTMGQSLKEFCEQVLERIDIVNKALAHQVTLNGQCMNYADFDTHSTPSRDGRLKDMATNLKLDFKELTPEQLNSLSAKTLMLLEGLFNSSPSEQSLSELKNYCPISYKAGQSVSLRAIRQRIEKGLLSSHPNDKLELRWGETSSGKTKCKAHY